MVALLLLVGCARPPNPDAWVAATTLLVRPCVPSSSSVCLEVDALPFAAGVQLAGETRQSRRHRCTDWTRISYLAGEQLRTGWVCASFLQPTPPTVASIQERSREHLARGDGAQLVNDVLMLAGLCAPSAFEAALATSAAAADQVRWARGATTLGEAVALAGQQHPGEADEAWWAAARGWILETSGQQLPSQQPLLWRRWTDPDGGGGFVMLQRSSRGNLFRFAGDWSRASGQVIDLRIVADAWEKDALQRAIDRVPGHLRRRSSPAIWTGEDG